MVVARTKKPPVERQDRAAKADRGQAEEGPGDDPEQDRPRPGAGDLRQPLLERHQDHANRRDHDGEPCKRGQRIAQHGDAEHRDLHRLGLDRRGHDRKRALAHRREHEGSGEDLGHRPHDDEADEAGVRRRHRLAGELQHAQEKERREGQAVEEAHLRRADRAERLGEAPLRRVARGLGGRRSERRRNPEKGEIHAGKGNAGGP